MIVEANKVTNQVTIKTDRGGQITLTWAAAANLSTLLSQKSHEAEPAPARGKSYVPAMERTRV
jgi:hypothetical protein